jgi:hypothetical protein
VLLVGASRRGLLFPGRKYGRYGERLFTLTIPHRPTDTIRGRIDLLLAAWRYFLKSLNAWTRDHRIDLEFVRVLEWTPGSDDLGHPHLHVWAFSTYLPQDFLTAWWRDALERAGMLLGDQEEILKVDVRAACGSDQIANELVKYIYKDIGTDGRYIDPATFAEVYAALDGRRVLQGSRGFFAAADELAACRHCGTRGALRARPVPASLPGSGDAGAARPSRRAENPGSAPPAQSPPVREGTSTVNRLFGCESVRSARPPAARRASSAARWTTGTS